MPYIIGIDLGTTNTAVAVLENGRPRVIEDDRGYKVLPSVISAKGEGRFVVGQAAHNLMLTRPDRTIYAAKRLIGRRFDSPEVQRIIKRVGYAVQEAPDGGVQLQVGDVWMTPSEVAAVVLQVARGIAERALGEPVEEAVITVPAHFNHAQRKATLEAAAIAGLRCERILNEPTAAALAYGHRRNVDRTLVIFDLGGGTFDVSVLRLSGGLYEILSTNGDTFLGGEDFDYRLVDHLVDHFKSRTGVDVREDRAALQRLKDAAERAKCELSFSDRSSIVVPHVAPGHNLELTLTRSQLEDLSRDLVERCIEVARDAVADAGLAISDVDEVILVGGQTRMPLVREAVAGLFGREPSRSVHPEEAVAIGAAVHAASLADIEGTPAVLLDVTPFDLGIDAAGGMFSRIVPKNARIPCTETRTFATVHDNQETVRITVRQGESRVAEENEFIGEFFFEGLTPAPRMQTKVGVTFRIDANGMLQVTAVEPGSGERRNIGIRSYADRNRSMLRPGGAGGIEAPQAAAPVPETQSKTVKKKVGFFDQLFGGGAAKKKPASKPRASTPEAVPAVAAAAATVAATPVPVSVDPASLAPPPVIQSLPTPTEPLDDLAPLDEGPLDLVAIDDLDESYAMPDELPSLEEDDLYEPATASFGLAGAHQVGDAAAPGDPFADLGTPAPARPIVAAPARGSGPTVWELGDADGLDGESLDAADLFGEGDAGDLFADAAVDDEQDPPTDPGLSFPGMATRPFASGFETVGGAPPAAAPSAPEAPRAGLHFEGLLDVPDAPDAPVEDDLGFAFAGAFEEEIVRAEPEPVGKVDDIFGFSFADYGDEPYREPAPLPTGPVSDRPREASADALRRPSAREDATEIFKRPVLDNDTNGFAFPMPEDGVEARKLRKPARVKLHYRERALLVAEYRENLERGGALIRTEKPLASGRDCVFEINGPGLLQPLVIPARVSRVLADGMEVEYRLDAAERAALLALLAE
ncbi:MAG: Hsp70 family protein [Pseudomonadota bacterium]|nr:Hsp70 family protein [Pseudomonadota bacterium]